MASTARPGFAREPPTLERLAEASVMWFKALFFDDPAAKAYLVGSPCKLCGQDADFEFGEKGL